MNDTLHRWMRSATTAEQQALADAATRGSLNSLEQMAGGHRGCSASKAGLIETASAPITKLSKGRLPRILRTDLCGACRLCPHAAKALGMAAVASDFERIKE